MELPTLEKQKPNSVRGSITIKQNIEFRERVIRKSLRNIFTLTIVLIDHSKIDD